MDASVKPSPERARFVALAQKRMNRAIKAIRAVGQLDRSRGGFGIPDVETMEATLMNEVARMRERLGVAANSEPDFRLDAQEEG